MPWLETAAGGWCIFAWIWMLALLSPWSSHVGFPGFPEFHFGLSQLYLSLLSSFFNMLSVPGSDPHIVLLRFPPTWEMIWAYNCPRRRTENCDALNWNLVTLTVLNNTSFSFTFCVNTCICCHNWAIFEFRSSLL